MADTEAPVTETVAKKPTRRRSTTVKAASPRAANAKVEALASSTPKKAKAPPKPRSTKRQATPVTRKHKAAAATNTAAAKIGGRWGAAAIAGGLAAAGAAAAALLTLRGSSAKSPEAASPKAGEAHQPDGTDSSASFDAGIADENTIPN